MHRHISQLRFAFASTEGRLGLEERNVLLLALISVSDRILRVCGGRVDVVRP